ncbi:hypothetical protein QTP70_005218 [Hemibagrus guttatus]|uniref:Armadillo-like helical domain-containing protein 4 n=1 Tax=Hemibagrus guttatus TaxID=175788 RepID=A0AAE0Q9E5_9TELE|nr:hypothetical protein QTP70_005218 [Hemibagrus guttatus]
MEPSTSPENYAEQKVVPFILPIHLRTDRPEPTQVRLGLSGYISLPYSDIEEDKGTAQPLTKPWPLKQEAGWDVKTSKNQFDELKSSRGISTEPSFSAHAPVSQSPRYVNSAVTALTTSHSYDGQTGGSTQDKKRVAEVNFFTATEQDKALVPGLLTLSSRLVELGDTWTEPVHLQGVEEASVLPLLQEVGTEATMSSEDLPLIFEPFDDVTPSSSSALASELSVAMVPATGMLSETELEQTLSMDTDHSLHQSFPGPSDWPSPWQMSGAENSDTVSSSQMPIIGPFSEADVEHSERTERLQNPIVLSTSVDVLRLSPSPVSATTQQVADVKSTHSAVLKPVSGLEELESQENEDEEDDYADESEEDEEESEEELTEIPVHSPTRPPYILIPPPPVWGQRNQGLIRSWVKLIREKAGYVSGMLAPVGIGIAGALLIVGALYGIRMIHRKRKNSLKHQRRKYLVFVGYSNLQKSEVDQTKQCY